MRWNKTKQKNQRALVAILFTINALFSSNTFSESRSLNTPQKSRPTQVNNDSAQVLFLQGIVRVDKRKAVEPAQLKIGSIIETGKGHATVRIGNDQVVDMDEDSRLRIVKIKDPKDGSTKERLGVVLEKGGIRGTQDVEPSDPRANANVITPSGILRLNGGRFVVGVDPEKNTKVLTLDKSASLDPTSPPVFPNNPTEEPKKNSEPKDDSKSPDLNEYKNNYTSNLEEKDINRKLASEDETPKDSGDDNRDSKTQAKNEDRSKDSGDDKERDSKTQAKNDDRSKDSGDDKDQGRGNDDKERDSKTQAKNDDRSKDSGDDKDRDSKTQAKNADRSKDSGDDKDQGKGNDDKDRDSKTQAKNDDREKDSGDDKDQGKGNDDKDSKKQSKDNLIAVPVNTLVTAPPTHTNKNGSKDNDSEKNNSQEVTQQPLGPKMAQNLFSSPNLSSFRGSGGGSGGRGLASIPNTSPAPTNVNANRNFYLPTGPKLGGGGVPGQDPLQAPKTSNLSVIIDF